MWTDKVSRNNIRKAQVLEGWRSCNWGSKKGGNLKDGGLINFPPPKKRGGLSLRGGVPERAA